MNKEQVMSNEEVLEWVKKVVGAIQLPAEFKIDEVDCDHSAAMVSIDGMMDACRVVVYSCEATETEENLTYDVVRKYRGFSAYWQTFVMDRCGIIEDGFDALCEYARPTVAATAIIQQLLSVYYHNCVDWIDESMDLDALISETERSA